MNSNIIMGKGLSSPTKSTKAGSTSNPGTLQLSQILNSGHPKDRAVVLAGHSSSGFAPTLAHKSSGLFAMSTTSEGDLPLQISELAVPAKYEHLWKIANRENPPKLYLRIKNGNSNHHNKVLEIDALGLKGSDNARNGNDGIVYFGTLKHSQPDAKGNIEVLNDFILPASQLPASTCKRGSPL